MLNFRPFRIVNKRVIVTSYMGWRKVAIETKKGERVHLMEDVSMVLQDNVYNHKGELLYWFKDESFKEVPVITYPNIFMVNHILFDVEGVPVFSHINQDFIKYAPHLYEPLKTNVLIRQFHAMNERLKVNFQKLLQ